MPTYRVDVNFSGIASVVIDAEDDEDACDKAQEMLDGASFPNMKMEDASVSLELDSASASQAEEWDKSSGAW